MSNIIELRGTGRSITVPAGMTILDAVLAAGIAYPHACRSGRCGSCRSRLVSGEVELLDHNRFALTSADKAQGLILACCAVPTTDGVVTWLEEEEAASPPHRRLTCRVAAIEDATHDIKRIQLVNDHGDTFGFRPGQYARLKFLGAPARDYSMASGPGDGLLEFHIRRVPGGAASECIHAQLQLGEPVLVEGPFGSSFLREHHTGPLLCIAGGSGLAPIKCIVDAAIAAGMKQPIHVYFGARGMRDIYLAEHFEQLAQQHSNLTFTTVLSETPAAASQRTGMVANAVAEDLQNLDGWKAYVAGPPLMVEAAMQVTSARGLQAQDLHADVFFTAG